MKKLSPEVWMLLAVLLIAVVGLWIVLAGPRAGKATGQQEEIRLDVTAYDSIRFDKVFYCAQTY